MPRDHGRWARVAAGRPTIDRRVEIQAPSSHRIKELHHTSGRGRRRTQSLTDSPLCGQSPGGARNRTMRVIRPAGERALTGTGQARPPVRCGWTYLTRTPQPARKRRTVEPRGSGGLTAAPDRGPCQTGRGNAPDGALPQSDVNDGEEKRGSRRRGLATRGVGARDRKEGRGEVPFATAQSAPSLGRSPSRSRAGAEGNPGGGVRAQRSRCDPAGSPPEKLASDTPPRAVARSQLRSPLHLYHPSGWLRAVGRGLRCSFSWWDRP